jgi:hypothetical protein
MFMSLVLPGSGQLYVGTKQSRYVRGIFYLAEEIALISGLYYHSIYKYDKQVKKYKDFANLHFSVSEYEKAMNEIYYDFYKDNFQRLYGHERENYCKAIYKKDENVSSCKNRQTNPEADITNQGLHNAALYYRVIANETLTLGWDDVWENATYSMDDIQRNIWKTWPDNYTPYILEKSENRQKYLSMRKKANGYADRQAIFLGALILNHIVSAVDAALSANAHNNSLYEEKLSFLDRIRLGNDFQIGENFRAGTEIRYLF